ncbi:MAG TPA: Hsp20/alpha crystallin family protein [Blastocatellia bacterium]|nr:Hsp20/alpha crystallin family protein [Blastocatellia bacterium]
MAEKRENQQATQQGKQQAQRGQGEQQSQAIQTTGREGGQRSGLARRGMFGPGWPASPFALMDRFAEEMDRIFEDFGFGRRWLTPFSRRMAFPRELEEIREAVWSPEIEVFEREGQIVVRADLPGLSRDDVKVDITDDALTIQGERKREHEERREGFYRSERSYGSFYRSIPLPEGIDADNAKASFRDGVLEITIPAPQRASRRRRIEIGEGAGAQQQRAGAQTTTK